MRLSGAMKPPQRLDQIDEMGNESDRHQVDLSEGNAHFMDAVRNFLLSTNQFVSPN